MEDAERGRAGILDLQESLGRSIKVRGIWKCEAGASGARQG